VSTDTRVCDCCESRCDGGVTCAHDEIERLRAELLECQYDLYYWSSGDQGIQRPSRVVESIHKCEHCEGALDDALKGAPGETIGMVCPHCSRKTRV
jgi:hypothetical protein